VSAFPSPYRDSPGSAEGCSEPEALDSQGPPVNQMVERSQALSEMVGHTEVVQAWLVQLVWG